MWSKGLSAKEIFDGIERDEVTERPAESALKMVGDWNGNAWNPAASTQPGVYAWGEAHLLYAYMVQYEATGERRYLETLAKRIRVMLDLRDSLHGKRDEVRGCIMPSWGSVYFSQNTPYAGKRTCWLVHAGMILYPMARFAREVRGSAELKERFGELALEIIVVADEILQAYEPYWREQESFTGDGFEGWYCEPILGIDRPMPMNQMNAWGRGMLEVDLAIREPLWQEHVESLARFFRNRIVFSVDGSCVWSYWPGGDFKVSGCDGRGIKGEDFSHAAINGDFALACCRAGVVFSESDIVAMARTVTEKIHLGGGNFADFIDGSGVSGAYCNSVAWWGELAEFDEEIARLIELRYRHCQPSVGGAAGMLAAAMVAKYGDDTV